MTAFLHELWALIVALWNTGNRLARWAIGILVFWPVLLLFLAAAGMPSSATATLALGPVAGLLFLLLARLDPLVVAVIAAFPAGRRVLGWFSTILGLELAIGVYLSVVPVANDPGLAPVFLLATAALLFLMMGGGRLATRIVGPLTWLLIIITVVFFLGGREGIARWQRARQAPPRAKTTAQAAAALDECSGWNAPMSPSTTRTITVRGEWITESIPFCYGLDMDPIEGPILYRLRDGQIFKKTPDGQRFTLNGEPAPRVRVPGNSVAIRSESGDSVRVILTAEPKS